MVHMISKFGFDNKLPVWPRVGGSLLLKKICLSMLIVQMLGCSVISYKEYKLLESTSACSADANTHSVSVFWGTVWRNDQKSAGERKGIAAAAIRDYFSGRSCFALNSVYSLLDGKNVLLLEVSDMLLKAEQEGSEYIYVIEIEELTPNLIFYLSPVLWSTHNEIQFALRVYEVKTGHRIDDRRIKWQRGGPFTFNRESMLYDDLILALQQGLSME